MAFENFKPEIWAEKIERKLENSLVFGMLANREYQGTIDKMGKNVHITTIGSTTIKDYTGAKIEFESPVGSEQVITIANSPYFALTFDDVDTAQALPTLMDAQIENAVYSMADSIDKKLAGLHTKISADTTIDAEATLLGSLTSLRTKLNRANVPSIERWIVLSPEAEGQLITELNNTTAPQTAEFALINGYVGRIRGFEIFVSNNVDDVGGVHKLMAGINKGINYLSKINSLDAGKHTDLFGDYVKGLNLYGADVTETKGGKTTLLGLINYTPKEPTVGQL